MNLTGIADSAKEAAGSINLDGAAGWFSGITDNLNFSMPNMGSFAFDRTWVLLLFIPLFIFLIWIIRKTFVDFKIKDAREEHIKTKKGTRNSVILLRSIVVLLLLIAIASPHTAETMEIPGDYSLTILADSSESMKLFKDSLAEDLKDKIGGSLPTTVRYIAYGNESAIGNALLNNMQGNDNIIVITDGNANKGKDLGDVLLLASSLNSTVNALDLEAEKDDTSITVSGYPEIIFGNDYTYYIDVIQVGEEKPYKLELYLDGEMIYSNTGAGSRAFVYTPEKWLLEGYHRVIGKLIINDEDDYFTENNIYYKSIHTYPKPEILFISQRDPRIERALERVYTYTLRNSIPINIKDYPVVILDDLPASEINPHVDRLINYVSEGNGLVVLGGTNSFDYGGYKDSLFEAILPAVVGIAGKQKEESDVNVVIVIDISGTTTFSSGSSDTKISVQKAYALDILEGLGQDVWVGAVAFDTSGYYVTNRLLPKKEQLTLVDTITNIKADENAGTYIYSGLDKADWLLSKAKGSKNVILISDGITQLPQDAYQKAATMAAKGVKVYTLGVGSEQYGTSDRGINEGFMKELARRGKGSYFKASQKSRLLLLFEDTKKDDQDLPDANELMLVDANHWITEDLDISARISGFNQVAPKSSARTLITTGETRPILTTWRFGLGRVAVLSTDTEMWAGELLSGKNSELITRTVNWAIWDPDKTKDFYVKTFDTNLGSTGEILAYSKKSFPKSENLQFSKIGDNAYKSVFTPTDIGFYNVFDTSIAVNTYREFQSIGLNPELRSLVSMTGGKMFSLNETEELVKFVKETSKRTKSEVKYYRWPVILAAIVIFLIEILIRRIKENRGM